MEHSEMIGTGTLVNSAAIVVGGVIGLLSGKLMKERFSLPAEYAFCL